MRVRGVRVGERICEGRSVMVRGVRVGKRVCEGRGGRWEREDVKGGV